MFIYFQREKGVRDVLFSKPLPRLCQLIDSYKYGVIISAYLYNFSFSCSTYYKNRTKRKIYCIKTFWFTLVNGLLYSYYHKKSLQNECFFLLVNVISMLTGLPVLYQNYNTAIHHSWYIYSSDFGRTEIAQCPTVCVNFAYLYNV